MMNYSSPIRLVTVSREFGAGGKAVGEQLAQALGWKLWDRELVHDLARVSGISERELADMDERETQVSLWDRLRGRPSHRAYLAALKEWMEQIAEQGNSVVIGRGAAILLRSRDGVFHVRLVAPLPLRAQRLRQREPALDEAGALAQCRQKDRERAAYIKYFFGEEINKPTTYHAIINTEHFPPESASDLLRAVVVPAADQAAAPTAAAPQRLLALTSQLGSRETDLAREVAKRLNLTLWGREALAREAGLADVADADLEDLDPKELETLRTRLEEAAQRGNALFVGRGAARVLHACPSLLRLKLVSPMEERIRRVMEYRWINERAAQAAIADSDVRRGRFYRDYFGIDWDDPVNFDLVLNTAALGPHTADWVVQAARKERSEGNRASKLQ